MGVFEDGESLFSPGIVVEKDQDRPSSKLYSCFTFTDLTASKLFKDFSIRRRAWTLPGLSAPQPDIASSVKAQAPIRIMRLGRAAPSTSLITAEPIHLGAPGRAR